MLSATLGYGRQTIMNTVGAIALLALLYSGTSFAQSNDGAIDELVATFELGDKESQVKACQALEWSGVEATQVFDRIEQNLRPSYQRAKDRLTINWIVWCTKALAFSGNPKYLDTIRDIAVNGGHRRIREYAEQSIRELREREFLNPVINRGVDGQSPAAEKQRFLNMIASDSPELNRLASKRIVFQVMVDLDIADALATKLRPAVSMHLNDLESDSYSWMIKALGVSGCGKYRDLIREISENAVDRKLRKYAAKVGSSC